MNRSFWRQPAWAHLRNASVAALSAAALALSGCGGSSSSDGPIEANINELVTQIGGATTAVEYYNDGEMDWTLYNMANRFAATPVGMTKGAVTEITVPGFIQNITVVEDYGPADAKRSYALLSMGGKGIGVVDITDPAAMVYVRTMTVNYAPLGYTYSDGGGTLFTEEAVDPATPLTNGPVNDVLVDDSDGADGATPDDRLFIANTAYGIQTTKLTNLLDAAVDGPVVIDGAELWTLKYAGEIPWGGPLSLKMHGGKLYAALGFLGIGIYSYDAGTDTVPATLVGDGAYNLYADCDYRGARDKQEDWFGYPERKISCPGGTLAAVDVDFDTDGMPTPAQAAEELGNKNSLTWYPWAEFEKYGKYYYNARTMELVDLPGGKTMAYIAYSLGGLVAVDVTDAGKLANPGDPMSVIKPTYAGYVPAAPAHGPDEPPINVDSNSIMSHFGSGMLKEAGVMDVRVVPDTSGGGYKAYYTDHFAGLVVVSGAEAPATHWKQGEFNNDCIPDANNACQPEPRIFWPDYEFVTSYDMFPVPVGDESLPQFLVRKGGSYIAPVLVSTGEINGHGGALFLLPSANTAAAGVDVVQSSGAGGVSFVDFTNLANAEFTVPVNLVSTNEIGAFEDGSPGQPIAIGHAEGVTVSGNHLYLADGPHGVSVWTIANGRTPIDTLHLVANTLQSEYPTGAVMPTPHAFKVAFRSDDPNNAYVMSQSLGMRRISVSAVTSGSAQVGSPAILDAAGGIYEHNTEAGNVGLTKVTGQDHAYGVTFAGKYAIVADGDNGLTVYDITADAGTDASVVANIGDSDTTGTGKPMLGRAATVKLWTDSATNKTYAVVAAGAYGISVVDMTAFLASGKAEDLQKDKLIKTFEPLKSDDDNAFGSADGKSVDVHVVGDIAYFSYDSFGLVAYRMADLIRPATEERPTVVPDGQDPDVCSTITDVTKLSAKQGGVGECRPTAVGYFKLQKLVGYEDLDGGALYMTPQLFRGGRLLFYVAYGDAGVIKLDWSNVATP
ncbi:MAG: hypothetical protein V2I51_09070, partial [Anderseniella sp.]|nr:hypothetical protein [Anderseniella sp.]